MKMLLKNTVSGLQPMYDDDYEEKRKLKIGEVYRCEVKKERNIRFHRKYFALINTAWSFLNEMQTAFFNENINGFRKTIEVAAGHYEPVYNLQHNEWMHTPKSIAFEKMDDAEFSELYERVKDILFNTALKNISVDEFMNQLANF